MRMQAFKTLFLSTALIIAAVNTGCTDHGKTRDANNKMSEAEANNQKAVTMQAELDAKIAAAQAQADANAKEAAVLESQKETWRNDEAQREQSLLRLQQQIADARKTLKDLQDQAAALSESIKSEEARIAQQKADIIAEQKRVSAELKGMQDAQVAVNKAADEANAKKQADLEARLTELAGKLAQVESEQVAVDQREASAAEQEKALAGLKASLAVQEANFTASLQATRELFARSELTDVFDNVMTDKKMTFLVRVIGFGSPANLNWIVNKIDTANKGSRYESMKKLNYEVSELRELSDSAPEIVLQADESFVVDMEPKKLKAVRDSIETRMQAQNTAAKQPRVRNSYWVVVRPVEQVRVGIKMEVIGSRQEYWNGRRQEVLASFENLSSRTATIKGLENVDLTNPGSYVFSNSGNAKACETVDETCFKVLMSEKLLDAQQKLDVWTKTGVKSNITASYRDLLLTMIKASAAQARYDLKDKMIVGWSEGKFDQVQFHADIGAALSSMGELGSEAGNWLGLGTGRAPVIDAIKLKYTVSMVEYVHPSNNHLDSAQFLFSGMIGTMQMMSVDRRRGNDDDVETPVELPRGEISIPLPIAKFSASSTKLEDLTMADYAADAWPKAKYDELMALRQKGGFFMMDSKVWWLGNMNVQMKGNLTDAELKRYNELKNDIEVAWPLAQVEIQNKFEERSNINSGMLELFARVLRGE